jgi:hypothetical protein
LLAFGEDTAAIARATQTAEAAGVRLAAALPVHEAAGRLGLQLNNGGVWLELEGDATPELEALLERLEADSNAGLYPVSRLSRVISSTSFLRA